MRAGLDARELYLYNVIRNGKNNDRPEAVHGGAAPECHGRARSHEVGETVEVLSQ
jgi:hypothetical protein